MTVQRLLQNRQSWEILTAAAFLCVSLFASVGEVHASAITNLDEVSQRT
jgi:hypothetical protein